MSVETFIKENINSIGNYNRIYISPNIEFEKLENTTKTICKGINKEEIIAIYDSTVFGSSKEGIVFTKNSLFYRGTLLKAIEIKYKDIKKISYVNKKIEINIRKIENEELIIIDVENTEKEIVIKNILKVNLAVLNDFINDVKNEFIKEELAKS